MVSKSHFVRAVALVITVVALCAAVGGMSWARVGPIPDRPACDKFSSANACEYAATRAQAVDAAWADSEIVLRDVRNNTRTLDFDVAGAGPADMMIFDDVVWNSMGTAVVGRFLGRCVQLTGAMNACQGSLLFAGGTIELSSVTPLGADIVAVVTGGTGEHAGVGGQALVTPTGTAGISEIRVDLF